MLLKLRFKGSIKIQKQAIKFYSNITNITITVTYLPNIEF